jgi:hypothetical protein
VVELPLEKSGCSPDLGRATVSELAAETLAPGAQFAGVTPKHMCWTNQPVLVRRVDLECVSILEQTGTSNERYVVKVDDVKDTIPEEARDTGAVHQGTAELLSEKHGEPGQPVSQRNDLEACRVRGPFR